MSQIKLKIDIRKTDFRKIFDEYFPSLCVFACKFVNDEDTAKDLVQEVFVKIWSSGKTFESEKSMRVYFYLATKNTAYDYIKKEKRKSQKTDLFGLNAADEDIVLNEMIREETYRILNNALHALPEKAKEVINLNLSGLSNQEVADKLGISVNTVKTHRLHALRILRKRLGNRYLIFL
jgi:RNA polymerase sigma-70 factor (family 1)